MPSPLLYTAENWYWIVAGDATKVFSSASGDYVLVADVTYQNWLSMGGVPTRIESEVSLGDVLGDADVRPAQATVLDSFRVSQATKIVRSVEFKILFNHENRLRTIERQLGLNGSPPNLTLQQAIAAVKALM